MTYARVSSGRSEASEPLKARPIGVRTASTMTASGMGMFLSMTPGGRTPRAGLPPAVALHGACAFRIYETARTSRRLAVRDLPARRQRGPARASHGPVHGSADGLGGARAPRRRRRSDPEPRGFVWGGAGTGDTMRANLEAFRRWRIVPRMLRDVSERDLRTTVLGTEMPGAGAARAGRGPDDPPSRRRARDRRARPPRSDCPSSPAPPRRTRWRRSPRRAATRPGGSSSTGPRTTRSPRAWSGAPSGPDTRRSSSRSTRCSWAGARPTCRTGTCPSWRGPGIAQFVDRSGVPV